MLSNDIIRLIKPKIEELLNTFYGIDASFKKGFQSKKVGANSDSVVYYHQLESKNLGLPKRKNYYNVDTGYMEYKEKQIIETTFQINSLVPKNPTITASDLVAYVRAIFTHLVFIDYLNANKLSVYKPTSIRSGWFESDNGGYEDNPSFDVTFQSELITDTTSNTISLNELNLKRI